MEAALDINDIILQIKKMDKKDQLNLLDRLLLLVRKPEPENKRSPNLSALLNANDNIWKNMDIEKYIEEERRW